MSDGVAEAGQHASLMDRMYRGQRHIYDLTRKYYLFGRDTTISGLGLKPGQTMLELGCGTGRNLALTARRFPSARLYGLDISRAMLETAESKFRKAGMPVTLVAGDATSFKASEFDVEGFDRIMISYALSMIPDWQGTIRAALDALSPQGELHIVDFGDQAGLPHWFKRMLRGWLKSFHVTPRDELVALLAPLAASRGRALTVQAIGGGYAIRAVAGPAINR